MNHTSVFSTFLIWWHWLRQELATLCSRESLYWGGFIPKVGHFQTCQEWEPELWLPLLSSPPTLQYHHCHSGFELHSNSWGEMSVVVAARSQNEPVLPLLLRKVWGKLGALISYGGGSSHLLWQGSAPLSPAPPVLRTLLPPERSPLPLKCCRNPLVLWAGWNDFAQTVGHRLPTPGIRPWAMHAFFSVTASCSVSLSFSDCLNLP